MNGKILLGSIVIIFITIVFMVPLSDNESKTSKIVQEVVQTTKEIVDPTSEKILSDEEKYSEENMRKHNTIVITPLKENSLKKAQRLNTKDELDIQIEESFAKLDAILKEKNLKLKEVKISEEKMILAQNKIEEVKKNIEKIKENINE